MTHGQTCKSKPASVLPSMYRPELDVSDLCNKEDGSYYHTLIGILQWVRQWSLDTLLVNDGILPGTKNQTFTCDASLFCIPQVENLSIQ